jgi:hypothetical protein
VVKLDLIKDILFQEKNFGEDGCWSEDIHRLAVLQKEYHISEPFYYYEFRTKYDNKYEIYSSNPNDNKGFWPAIWMLGGSCPGNYQEIDFYDNQLKGQVYTVGYIYCDVNSNRSENGKYAPFNNFIFNENNFNINAGLWTKKTINYILNDQIVYSSINNDAISYPMQIRIDQNCDVMNSSLYPIKHVIDYVRIWRLRKDCNTIVTIIPNFNTFTYGIKKSITLSNSTTIPLNSNISLLATDYIELNNNFFIPNICPRSGGVRNGKQY